MSITDTGDKPKREKGLTPKQEAFVAVYMETGNASEAYRRSYNCKPDVSPDTVKVNASKLLADTNVALTIESRRAKAAEKAEITLLDIARMLQEAHSVGQKAEDAGAMTEAAMSLAKLMGHYTEKKHVTSDNRNHNVEERLQPTAEWVAGLLGDRKEGKASGSRPN